MTTSDTEIDELDTDHVDLVVDDKTTDDLESIPDRIRTYLEQSLSENTKKAYTSDWNDFTEWCREERYSPLPAQPLAVADYIRSMADGDHGHRYKASTIQRRLVTIRLAHRAKGLDDPTDSTAVQKTWRGLKRDDSVQVAPEGKDALLLEDLRRMVEALDLDTVKGLRDRALLLFGFASALRRSELVGLDVDDLELEAQGVWVDIGSSKSDQAGEEGMLFVQRGETDFCPISALEEWIERAGIEEGPIFRGVDRWGNVRDNRLSGRGVNRAVKAAAETIGLDASKLGAHSLRSGFVTQAKIQGQPDDLIMSQTRHASKSTMKRYDKEAKARKYNTTAAVGL